MARGRTRGVSNPKVHRERLIVDT